jgi:hypothetical protein
MSNQIVQLNLIELELVSAPESVIVDPFAKFEEKEVNRPKVAEKTVGPHRYTIMVPHDDKAMVSVGQGAPHRIKDTGITGRTNSHIHFETREGEETARPAPHGPPADGHHSEPAAVPMPASAGELKKTLISLGGGTEDAIIKSYDPVLPKNSSGFTMITLGKAWNESFDKYYVLSREEDVTLRTTGEDKRVVLQADKGKVDVIAFDEANTVAKSINIVAPMATPIQDKKYDDVWDSKVPVNKGAENWFHYTEGYAIVTGIATLLGTGIAKMRKGHKKGKKGQVVQSVLGWAHWGASMARQVLSGNHLLHALGHHESPGSIKVSAAADYGVVAASTAAMYGGMMASMTSTGFATVMAPLVTAEGLVFCGIGAPRTSIEGLLTVEIEAPLGNVVIDAKKEIEIECHGEIMIGAHHGVFVRSEGHTGVYGEHEAYLGAGGDAGFGVAASGKELKIGKISSKADDVEHASFDENNQILFTKKVITIKRVKSQIELDSNRVLLSQGDSSSVKVTSSNIYMNGSKIFLD